MVGCIPLEDVILVRVQVRQPRNIMTRMAGLDSNTFTPVEESIENRVVFKVGGSGGESCVYVSIPSPAASY